MNESGFLLHIPALVKAKLPKPLQTLSTAKGFALVKIYYGHPKLHYEVALRSRANLVEVGLHFESDGLTNAQLLGAFRSHERAIRKALPEAQLEEWDKGWTRIWEPVAYEKLDAALQRAVVQRTVAYIRTLEPILRDELPADVQWTPQATGRSPSTSGSSAARTPRASRRPRSA